MDGHPRTATTTILFTDLVGSTEILEQLGDRRADELRRRHFATLRGAVRRHGGQEIKSLGDGLMVAFASAGAALSCACEMQAAVATDESRLQLRVGIEIGEPLREASDLHGRSVVVASRLCNHARGGQILASELIRRLVGAQGPHAFTALDPIVLKGFSEPIAVAEVDWTQTTVPDRARRPVAAPEVRPRSPEDLLERDADIGVLTNAVDALRSDGAGAVVLIEGPPGIGKTALLEAALAPVHTRGLGVLRARGSELEAVLAFGGARQLFTHPVLALGDADREELLAGPAGLARPVLGLAPASGSALGDPLFGLFWLAVELSERTPLVLAIDDLHWLDDESGRFAAYLAERAEGTAILLVATARPREPGAAQGPVATLAERGSVVRPQPLSEAAVGELLKGSGGEGHRATGGNPLFVSELRRALQAAPGVPIDEIGPASIAKLVLARVGRLSEDASELARAAALFADAAEIEDVAALAGLGEDAAVAAADALIGAQILAEDERLRFVHPVMRRAVYDDLGSFTRRRGHGRAAQLLKQRGAAAEAIAAHLLAGSPAGDVEDMRLLRAAADEAEGRRALHAAVRYLERALAEEVGERPERAEMRARLGRLQAVTGRPEAQATLRQAAAETDDDSDRADLMIDLGKVAFGNDRGGEVVEDLVRLRDTLELDPQRSLALDAVIATCAHTVDLELFHRTIDRLPPDLSGDTEAERLVLSAIAHERYLRGEPAAVVRDLVLRAAGSTGEVERDVGTDVDDSTDLLTFCGDPASAEAFAQERVDRARETGAEAAYATAHVVLCGAATARGDMLSAEAAARLGLATHSILPRVAMYLELRLHDVVLAQGRWEEAAGLRAELAAAGYSLLDRQVGLTAAARGDAVAAIAAFERTRAAFEARDMRGAAQLMWREQHADALAAVGRHDEAVALMEDYLGMAERFDESRVLGIAHLGLGRHLPGADGRAHLEQAVALLDPSPFRRDAARARLELGSALRHEGRREAARALLLPALDYAEQQRLAPLTARLRKELRLAGWRPRSAPRTAVGALTPSEDRIARLAAGGMTDKEIAQHLFLTVKTVETHLAGTFRKLEVRSRRDLPRSLGARDG